MINQELLAGAREGDVLAGKYRVDKVLGVGGMGVVVAAHHIHLDDRVAIKFLLPETLGNSDAVMRFAREARAAVKIKSEHVARVTDVGTMENGAPYMVMEYLEGSDLSAWLKERGRLPFDLAIDFILQACEALAEAHALGIVHRDLKPANLFVARLPGGVESVKVLDFGISKLTGFSASGGESSATKTSALMGSPLYMSPEQMRSSKDVDTRSDLWAIGVILYELLSGTPPFVADSMPELVLKIMEATPTPLRQARPDAPDGFEAVILRCLERDRNRRYQTVGDLAAALAVFAPRKARASIERITQVMQAAGMSASLPALSLPSHSDSERVGASTAAAFGKTSPGHSRTKPALLLVGGIITVGAVVALGLGRGHGQSNVATSALPVPSATQIAVTAAAPTLTAAVTAAAPTLTAVNLAPTPKPTPAETAVPTAPSAAPAPSGAPRKVPAPASAARPRPAVVAKATPADAHPAAAPVAKKASENSLIDDRQ